jgi:hypothetical protein
VTTSSQLTIWGVSDTFDLTTQNYSVAVEDDSNIQTSDVYVTWDYNGLIAHAKKDDTHFILAAPSIMTFDTSNTEFLDIVSQRKFVYDGFNNIPSSYAWNGLTMSGWFDFNITSPLLYEWTKEDLGSYGWLKLIDEGIKSTYKNFPVYRKIAAFLDDYSLWYLERIIWTVIWINPIKPFYCSDILQSKLITNIALNAIITASPSSQSSSSDAINDGVTSTEWPLDLAYESLDWNASIFFEWPTSQKIWYLKIYNPTSCCSNRLSWANIKLYNDAGDILYSHALWNTSNDFVVDLDLEWLGQLHSVKKLSIETVGGNKLSVREVEIFLWWNVVDGEYKVDKDGLWGQSPYKVFCDMTTDGGGWTRIWENYINNWNFEGQFHVEEYTFQQFDSTSDNLIVSAATMAPPVYLPNASVLKHSWSTNESYQMYFPSIPGEYFAQEIRLSAWVKWTTGSIFKNTVNYESTTSSTQPNYEVLDEIDGWSHMQVRIPLTWLVSDFTWDLWGGLSGPFYVTGLKMEVYYR